MTNSALFYSIFFSFCFSKAPNQPEPCHFSPATCLTPCLRKLKAVTVWSRSGLFLRGGRKKGEKNLGTREYVHHYPRANQCATWREEVILRIARYYKSIRLVLLVSITGKLGDFVCRSDPMISRIYEHIHVGIVTIIPTGVSMRLLACHYPYAEFGSA